MTLEQIKSEMLYPLLFSFKLRSLDRTPRMRAKCKAQDADTPESQRAALDELLELFSCDVKIKIWFHFDRPVKSLKTEPRTRWIRIERTEAADMPSARQIWREKCREELMSCMGAYWAGLADTTTHDPIGDALLMTLCLNAAAFWSEREDNPELMKDTLGEPFDSSVKEIVDGMAEVIGEAVRTSDSFCSGIAESRRLRFLSLVAEAGVEFGLEPIDGFVTPGAKARYYKASIDTPSERGGLDENPFSSEAIRANIVRLCTPGIYIEDLLIRLYPLTKEMALKHIKHLVKRGLIEEHLSGEYRCYRLKAAVGEGERNEAMFSETALLNIATLCKGGLFVGDLLNCMEKEIAVPTETLWKYIKEAIRRDLIEEYSIGDDQCYRAKNPVEGGEQP